jgi:hypothetical protein
MLRSNHLLIIVILSFSIISCSKTEQYPTPSISDYLPLQTGKYITYQLDSTIFINFGTKDTTISYQVKYVTDSLIADNTGRPAYRIFRYIRKTPNDAWISDATMMAINTGISLEWIENNLRFVKLRTPITENYNWKGHTFIDTYSANSQLQYMDGWDYTYTRLDGIDTLQNKIYTGTLTVNQRDEIIGIPDDPDSYSEINFGQEKYAKGIGLIYKKFFHSEYQPGNGGYFADGSYGVTYTIIDHN